jgi:mono/diheme cytochrome c family protein
MRPPLISPLTLALGFALAACGEPSQKTPTGREVYLRHCASCHGLEGRGNGPLAEALVMPPSDLTSLAQRNGGRFDEAAVMGWIDGTRHLSAHGPREMPVWGGIFESEHAEQREPRPAWVALLKIRSLVDYLRSIQEP